MEHEAEVLRDLQRRNAAARPLPEVGRELPAPETGLMIALAFAQASAQDVLELAGIVAGGGLVRQIEVALDDVVDVLQDHCGPLLDVLRGVEQRRRAAFGRTEGGGGQQGGLDLVAPDVGEPDGPLGVFLGGRFVLGVKAEGLEQIDAVNRITQPGVPVDGFHKAPRGGRGDHVVAHALGLHFRTSETGIVAPYFNEHGHQHRLLSG